MHGISKAGVRTALRNPCNKGSSILQAREHLQHQSALEVPRVQTPPPIPPMQPVPKPAWFLALYIRDVVGGIEETKAQLTSTFGTILKMDSTKKVLQTSCTNQAQGLCSNSKCEVHMRLF